MRVGLPHLGQSVDFVVSMIFLRSAVFAILAIAGVLLLRQSVSARTYKMLARGLLRRRFLLAVGSKEIPSQERRSYIQFT